MNLARRLSQVLIPSLMAQRPSVATVFHFDDDRNYLQQLEINSLRARQRKRIKDKPEKVFVDEVEEEKPKSEPVLERTIRFMSIMYAFLLLLTGSMCTFFKIDQHENIPRNVFVILSSLAGLAWIIFWHVDILRYKRKLLTVMKENNDSRDSHLATICNYDSVSVNTAVIFDYQPTADDNNNNDDCIRNGYRYFQGKHSNDFYLKSGMIVFCFGSMMHLGIGIVQQSYFYFHDDQNCQNLSQLLMQSIWLIFSFYQLFISFKYSNIIINRHKNVARFALMHLIAVSISMWLDTIIDNAIDDYVSRKLKLHINISSWNFDQIFEEYDLLFRNHILHEANCSRLDIVDQNSMSALPYLYPFTIEFTIAIASVWYMIWTNIGKVDDKSLFHHVHEEIVETENGDEEIHFRSPGLMLTVDCHSSNKGLFSGLAILFLVIISIVIFFTTIQKDLYSHFAVMTYTLQLFLLTLSCFVTIPIAYYRMNKLNVVNVSHQNNAFTTMDDILILIPIPFYFIHHVLSIVASLKTKDNEFELNNYLLIGIDILTICQVVIQSPFIVDSIRRCANEPRIRYQKPGRELVILILILNVALWILNTFELKSVELYHATHIYFGEFFSMILSHATLPLMLFYRFHSSVCLSNIWKYAYEKDE